MTRAELEYAIRLACEIADDNEIIVIGSQSILGQFPNAPAGLRQSVEVDVIPKNRPERADLIDGALGQDSPFHSANGFYVHGLDTTTATLPTGWESRVVPVRPHPERAWVGLCLQGYDLAASKLAAFRDKDRDFVRVLLAERMLDGEEIIVRLRLLPIDGDSIDRLSKWVERTMNELRLTDRSSQR